MMMRSVATQVALTTLAIGLFFRNSDSAKSIEGNAEDVRVRIEVKILGEGDSAAGPVEEVFIAGNIKQLGAWQPDGLKLDRIEANVFGAEFSVRARTAVQFKVTRGSWQTVEKNKLGMDIANREFVAAASDNGVPQKVSILVERWGLSRPVKSTVTGVVKLHEQVTSKHLRRSRNISIWLPPKYEETDQRFPVLYLQDGQNLFDRLTTAFGEEWRADEAALELIEKHEMPAMIIVGIWNTADRMDEYTLTKDERMGAGGWGLDYIQFMTEELKPLIDRTYRTQADRNSTFIGGSSLGGLIAMHACLQKPEVFSCCLAFSPTLGWSEERRLKSFQSEVIWPADVRLWFSMGTREGRDTETQKLNITRAQRLHRLLDPTNTKTNEPMQIQLQVFTDGTHDEKSWSAQFPVALRAIWANRE
jgi:predicted alpha/beta superfamily hydrolase